MSTRFQSNARLQYTPVKRETPIEGIGGVYRAWRSLDKDTRDGIVEALEFGHKDPDDEQDWTDVDWENVAKESYDNVSNDRPDPWMLGWDPTLEKYGMERPNLDDYIDGTESSQEPTESSQEPTKSSQEPTIIDGKPIYAKPYISWDPDDTFDPDTQTVKNDGPSEFSQVTDRDKRELDYHNDISSWAAALAGAQAKAARRHTKGGSF